MAKRKEYAVLVDDVDPIVNDPDGVNYILDTSEDLDRDGSNRILMRGSEKAEDLLGRLIVVRRTGDRLSTQPRHLSIWEVVHGRN